jgi:hypothetical protein
MRSWRICIRPFRNKEHVAQCSSPLVKVDSAAEMNGGFVFFCVLGRMQYAPTFRINCKRADNIRPYIQTNCKRAHICAPKQ